MAATRTLHSDQDDDRRVTVTVHDGCKRVKYTGQLRSHDNRVPKDAWR
ncbi:hypothetical protein I546_0921 [Mycobacterium kansasii 732]|nr:hypothetical protein I546_0921 [Mycobacterium kansasii 732]